MSPVQILESKQEEVGGGIQSIDVNALRFEITILARSQNRIHPASAASVNEALADLMP